MNIVTTVLSYVAALLVLGVIIFIHELGHYGVARLFKFKVLEFAIGMGPRLVKWNRNETLYSIRAVPIGGFCRFYGEDEAVKDEDSFNAHPAYKRFLVILAGAVMNLVAAYLLSVIYIASFGDIVPMINTVTPDSPAAVAGVTEGDRITNVDGKNVYYMQETIDAIRAGGNESIALTVQRGEDELALVVRGAYNEEAGYCIIGVGIGGGRIKYPANEVFSAGFRFMGNIITETYRFLGSLFTRPVQQGEVMGPVGVVTELGNAVRGGWEVILFYTLMISINLGIMNLLPFPGLDGSRLVFIAIEGIAGRPVKREIEGWIHFAGVVMLMGLVVVLTYSDIKRLFGG